MPLRFSNLIIGFPFKRPSVVLIGKTGDGKSALGNFLLNRNYFTTSSNPDSETIETKIATNFEDNINVIDTPGLNDSKGRDQKHYENIIQFIKNENITSFLLVLNFSDTRLSLDRQEMIKIYCNIFNINIINQMGLVFTKAFVKNKNTFNELKSIKKCKYRNYVKEVIENFYNKTIDGDLPCFFIDSDLDEPDDNSLEEKNKIIKWIKNSNYLNMVNLEIKDNLRIKSIYRETEIRYNERIDGNYKIQDWDYYERYNKVDINNNTIYGNWSFYKNERIGKKLLADH